VCTPLRSAAWVGIGLPRRLPPIVVGRRAAAGVGGGLFARLEALPDHGWPGYVAIPLGYGLAVVFCAWLDE
jgi:hypothetical protein